MIGMGLIFTPVFMRRLLGPPDLFGLMTRALLGLIEPPNGPVGSYVICT